jgi:Zn-dependent protease with chaperone function
VTDSAPDDSPAASAPGNSAIFFDGLSSRRRAVLLGFADALEISEDEHTLVAWPYSDIRRADGPSGTLRLTCLTGPVLARLEIRDATVAAEVISRCARLDEDIPGRRGVAAIVGWSLAAAISIVAVVLFGVPLAADRLTPLVPQAFERRFGDVAAAQIRGVFGGKVCDNAEGQAAFTKLVSALREAGGFDTSIEAAVLSSPIPNAFALPGGRVFLFEGLLAKAGNADEIAGILAHELGHVRHRDGTRSLIHNGGASFLIGLLFGDVTGSGAVIFASRTLVTASHSREVEQEADSFAIDMMNRLGRSPKPMGELMFRVTGKEDIGGLSYLANHPLTEDRLARMSKLDAPPTGPPLLTPVEWSALKSICRSGSKV